MAKVNIDRYRRRAYRKKKTIVKFLRKLGKSKIKGILKTASEADKEVWQEVSCVNCANCCKKMTPTYSRKDINRIAAHFNMTYRQFYDKWLMVDENKDMVNQTTPCQFLGKNNMCTIYEIRPQDCADFPHFTRKDFRYQVQQKVFDQNITYCPATLVFVEKMHERLAADL